MAQTATQEILAKTWLEQSPCRVACPVHTDAQGYIWLIAQGRFVEAYEKAREVNPFVSTLGRVCAHPCETECRRAQVDKAVAICALKRFAVDKGRPDSPPIEKAEVCYPEKVAVIGGGPSGLTAAHDLAKLGYRVTVFEMGEKPGGMFYNCIPTYRLPRTELAADVANVTALGVEIKTGVEVGKDITVRELQEQGYKAMLVSVGLSLSRGLPIPGADGPGVLMALPFLKEVNFTGTCKDMPVGSNVIVIGGGNVAIDVARSALRAGAGSVKMACLESWKEVPASPWEIEEAREEGVEMNVSKGPKAVLRDKNCKVFGLEFRECVAVFDAEGRFNPKYDDACLLTLEGDIIIFAIGQGSDLTLAKDTEIQLNPRGQLIWDRNTYTTTQPGVFACGEVVTGPGNAVRAISTGHGVATAIHRYLRGENGPIHEPEMKALGKLEPATIERIVKRERVKMRHMAPEDRVQTRDEFEYGYTEEEAIAEAQRCLACAAGAETTLVRCANCLTCLRVCPFGVPVIGKESGKLELRLEQCQACGICARDCPAAAIVLRRDQHDILPEILGSVDLKTATDTQVMIYRCHYGWHKENGTEDVLPANTQVVDVLCSARLDILDVLRAFEAGADGVAVAICAEGNCHLQGDEALRRRAHHIRRTLDQIGLGKDRFKIIEMTSPVRQGFASAVNQFSENVRAQGPILAKKGPDAERKN